MSFKLWLQLRLRSLMRPVVRFFAFFFYDTYYVDGDHNKVIIGERCGLANTLFSVASGHIRIGSHSIFGYNVMLLTGRHLFANGRRVSLEDGQLEEWGGGDIEVPVSGYDINIGSGCWIASGAIVQGGVSVGNNVIVMASSVVTKDVPDFSIVAGVPATIVGDTRDL